MEMNLPLRDRWLERLEAAQTGSSWSARLEARVLTLLAGALYRGEREKRRCQNSRSIRGRTRPRQSENVAFLARESESI